MSHPIMLLLFLKAHCGVINENARCEASIYWSKGFVAFQAAINAAIIEVSNKLKKFLYCK